MKFEFPPPDGSASGSGSDGVVATGGYAAWSHSDRWSRLPHVEDWRGYAGDSSDTGTLRNAIDQVDMLPLRLSPSLVVEEEIRISRGGISLIGAGWGSEDAVATQPSTPACRIDWGGGTPAAGTAIINVKATAASTYIWDFFIDRVTLRGANAAPVGLRLSSTRTAHIGRLFVERCTENGVLLDDANGVLNYSTRIDELYVIAGSNAACLNMNGLNIRQYPAAASVGCTWTHGGFVYAAMQSGDGVVFGNVDNCHFAKVAASSAGGVAVRFRGLSDGQLQVSRKNFIAQFSGQEIYAETKSRNAVDWVNSEGTSVTVEPGASLHYKVIDREDGRRWSTFLYPVNAHLSLPVGEGYLATGTPAFINIGATKTRGVALDGASSEAWAWTIPPQRSNSGGRVTGVKCTGVKSVGTNAGNVQIQISGIGKGTTSSLGGAMVSGLYTHTVDGAGLATLEEFEITFASPLDYPFDCHFIVHFTRLGADVLDTFPDDWCLLSMTLLYEANVANGDPPDYRYDVPDDIGDTTG